VTRVKHDVSDLDCLDVSGKHETPGRNNEYSRPMSYGKAIALVILVTDKVILAPM